MRFKVEKSVISASIAGKRRNRTEAKAAMGNQRVMIMLNEKKKKKRMRKRKKNEFTYRSTEHDERVHCVLFVAIGASDALANDSVDRHLFAKIGRPFHGDG